MCLESTIGKEFINAYIECALWSSTDDDGDPLDNGNYELSDEARELLRQDAWRFYCENIDLINDAPDTYSYAMAGHDYWLTRNGHGAGYWDRGLGDIGDKLTANAHAYGSCDLYIGDDGLIYA